MLHGMSTMQRTGDVLIFFHPDHRTIQCPFSLGPLELVVTKLVQENEEEEGGKDNTSSKKANKKRKSAKAVTELMLGLMDIQIDRKIGKAVITQVIFDEPGGVDVQGSLKRRANVKDTRVLPYK